MNQFNYIGLFDKLFGEVGKYRAAVIGLGNVSKSVLWDRSP